MSLRQGWDAQAEAWVAWARAPEHDSYWRFHRDAFLPLIPSPGRLTLDVGCGEGRVSRDLKSMGHRVVGIDSSWAMSYATTRAARATPAVTADATSLPLPSGIADCVVAFMALHDIDDMPAALHETARVLKPGGILVMAISHPVKSAGRFVGDSADPDRPFVVNGSWYEQRQQTGTMTREGLTMTFHSRHRPLQAYTEALADAGFVIERMLEPPDPAPVKPCHSRIPMFLDIRAKRT